MNLVFALFAEVSDSVSTGNVLHMKLHVNQKCAPGLVISPQNTATDVSRFSSTQYFGLLVSFQIFS